jgi:hypothetical protein
VRKLRHSDYRGCASIYTFCCFAALPLANMTVVTCNCWAGPPVTGEAAQRDRGTLTCSCRQIAAALHDSNTFRRPAAASIVSQQLTGGESPQVGNPHWGWHTPQQLVYSTAILSQSIAEYRYYLTVSGLHWFSWLHMTLDDKRLMSARPWP